MLFTFKDTTVFLFFPSLFPPFYSTPFGSFLDPVFPFSQLLSYRFTKMSETWSSLQVEKEDSSETHLYK